jgi:hypothetical protein
MGNLFRRIKKIVNESKVDPKDIVSFGNSATDNENLQNLRLKFEKIIKSSKFHKSLLRVNVIGFAKLIAYFSDSSEAKKFEEWAIKQFKNTKLLIIYKTLTVGESRAGVIFDFAKM